MANGPVNLVQLTDAQIRLLIDGLGMLCAITDEEDAAIDELGLYLCAYVDPNE